MGNTNSNIYVQMGNYQVFNNCVYYNNKKLSLNRKKFIYCGSNHCKDNNKIFYKYKLINTDYVTWKYLVNNYSIDMFNVYYKGRVIKEADVKTFRSPIKTNNEHAYDKKYNYFFGESIKLRKTIDI